VRILGMNDKMDAFMSSQEKEVLGKAERVEAGWQDYLAGMGK
jgi:hypothetical protein